MQISSIFVVHNLELNPAHSSGHF